MQAQIAERINLKSAAEETESVSQEILNLVLEMHNVLPNFHRESLRKPSGAGVHLSRILSYVRARRPVELILPAFPAKSPNREKTLGPLPDYGEALALKRMQRLCDSIAQVYEPGAQVVICSDGRVFSDLVHVPDPHVTAYGLAIRDLIERLDLHSLRIFNLEDAMPSTRDYGQMRDVLVQDHAETLEQIRERVIANEDEKQLFNGIHRFLFEDVVVLKPELSRSKSREVSKRAAYGVIQRSHAWSHLLAGVFENAVRLSIHPQSPSSVKIGVRLLPSEDIWRTPWHSTVLFDGQVHKLVPRREAERQGARLCRDRHGYEFFATEGVLAKGAEDAFVF